MAIVEDKQQTPLLLQLYHQTDETVIRAKEILEPNRICILKEPFFKRAADGSYSLRVDYVSDVTWLNDTNKQIPTSEG